MSGRSGALSAVLGAAIGLAGCQQDGGSMVASRPVVEVSAADLFSWGPSSASQQMEFYDELERRPIATQDDAVHAVLLLGAGASAPTYQSRVAAAKGRGWLPAGYTHPAREAVTVGEVSLMLSRVLKLESGARSTIEATEALRHEGLVPAQAQESQTISGSQLLSLLAGARDAMAATRPTPVNGPSDEATLTKAPAPSRPVETTPSEASKDQVDSPIAMSDVQSESPPHEPSHIVSPPPAPPPRSTMAGAPIPMSEPLPDVPSRRHGAVRRRDAALELLAAPGNTTPRGPVIPMTQTQSPAIPLPTGVNKPTGDPSQAAPKPGTNVPGKPLRKPLQPVGEPTTPKDEPKGA